MLNWKYEINHRNSLFVISLTKWQPMGCFLRHRTPFCERYTVLHGTATRGADLESGQFVRYKFVY